MVDYIELIAWGLTIILGIVGVFLKKNIGKVVKEIKDVVVALENALADNKITKDELTHIMDQSKEALEAIKGVVKR